MLKQRHEQIQILVRVTDVVVSIAAFFGAYFLRTTPAFLTRYGGIGSLEYLSWMLAASIAIHLVLYPLLGFYHSLRLKRVPEILRMILNAWVMEFFILGALVFIFQAKETSRYFFGLFLGLNYVLLILEKVGARALLSTIRKRGYNFRQVLVVGSGPSAARVVQSLRRNKHWGYVPCGILDDGAGPQPLQPGKDDFEGVPVLGYSRDLEAIVRGQAVDEVFFAQEKLDAETIAEEVATCERIGIALRFSLGMFELPQSRVMFSRLDSLPVVTFYTTMMNPMEAFIKRLLDLVISVTGLTITAFLYPWISYRIRRESPGPVIFKQIRVGENGRRFKCYKFRTMYLDAESRKQELMASNKMEGPLFKLENDPRIFPFGNFLRKSSLDELPQFFNILRGDMSVVGTRPPTVDEVNVYRMEFRRRLSIRPGLTGLWQVSGRNQINRFEDVLALDLKYIDNWSLWLDIKIILKTILVVFYRRGAY